MKKRVIAVLLAAGMTMGLAACGSSNGSTAASDTSTDTASTQASTSADGGSTQASGTASTDPVTITVVSSFGSEDGNHQNFLDGIEKYEEETGNTVKETSATADENWKAQVMTDFQSNAEPDVLFFYNGADSNPIIQAGKVVSIDEIRKEYPDYASNMKDNMMGASPVDGVNYSVPAVGYWEALYVNKKVLQDAGVNIPSNTGYTWDQFLEDCQKVKDAGYTPIACSLQQTPHYWFEYSVFDNDDPATHTTLPESADDAAGKAWQAGLTDLTDLYNRGYFPDNTLTATDDETFLAMATDDAAFAIDGSWKYGWFKDNVDDMDQYIAICPPAKEGAERTQNDIIGGISMGYYITKKAWDDQKKRDACVKFVETMTSDDVISTMAVSGNITALKDEVQPSSETNGLLESIYTMNSTVTSVTGATQDGLLGSQRDNLMSNIKNVVTGSMTPADAVSEMLSLN